MTAWDVAEKSGEIAERLFAEYDFSTYRTVHSFIPISKFNEIETATIFERIWTDFPNIRTAVPSTNRSTDELEHYLYTRTTDLVENAWGIREPSGGEKADPKEIDLALVPLLCFDERGYRVGYGKGYYDRFLRLCRADCLKVGLSFFPPEPEIDDIHDGDVRLDACITPDRVYLMTS